MYSQWLKVHEENKSLVSRVTACFKSNESLEFKSQVTEKESKLKEVSIELERT